MDYEAVEAKGSEFSPELVKVVTLSEARFMWGISRKSILMRLYKGDLIGRKSCNIWLVTTDSLLSLWGTPKNGFKDWENE